MKRILLLIIFCLSSFYVSSQDKIKITEEDYNNDKVEMADTFRSEGKIYVLTGVIVLILGGIVFYLVMIDRKISKIEKQLPNS